MNLKPRDVQTQVKHYILETYLGAWGGIILNGLRHKAQKHWERHGVMLELEFVYVDCFAYMGKFSGNTEDFFLENPPGPVDGSPLISIRTLDSLSKTARGIPYLYLKVSTILVERDRTVYQTLIEVLRDEGYGERLCLNADFDRMDSGKIAVVNGDAVQMVNNLTAYTDRQYVWAFYLIDPFGASGHPHDFVQRVVRGQRHDVMINFMYHDLNLKAGILTSGSEKARRSRRHVEYWSEAYGGGSWKEIVDEVDGLRELGKAVGTEGSYDLHDDPMALYEESKTSGKVVTFTANALTRLQEELLVNHYMGKLQAMDRNLAVKSMRLRFPDKERPIFYLFLTTHDGTGALKLNSLLWDAQLLERDLRYIRRSLEDQQRAASSSQLFLIPPEKPEPQRREVIRRPNKETCAQDIMRRFAGRRATLREVYREMADEFYFANEIKRALRLLKKNGRAQFGKSLNNSTSISFNS